MIKPIFIFLCPNGTKHIRVLGNIPNLNSHLLFCIHEEFSTKKHVNEIEHDKLHTKKKLSLFRFLQYNISDKRNFYTLNPYH